MRRTQSAERVSWRLTGSEKLRRETRKGVLHSECCRPSGSGIPKPKEASGAQHPTGRWKRPLGTADKVVKDSLSVPALNRSFSGYSYGLQRPWPDQRPFVIIRGRSPVRDSACGDFVRGDRRKPAPYRDAFPYRLAPEWSDTCCGTSGIRPRSKPRPRSC